MKYLVILKPRIGTGITRTVQMIRAQKETVLGALKRGEIDCTYAFVGGGGFRIQNANSTEELNQRLMGSPLGLFYEFDVRALTDYAQFMDTVAEAVEKQSR
jgi:glycine betaine/choline ABC-type transport system substrate-binding protein